MMKKILVLSQLFFLISCATLPKDSPVSNSETATYAEFLKTQHTSEKDYIFNLFKKYDIVILCERDHAEVSQYDLVFDILKDKRFVKEVGNLYCEVGNPAYNKQLNEFLHNPSLSEQQVSDFVLSMQRNIFPFIWDKRTYSHLVHGLYNINKTLSGKKINLYSLDFFLTGKQQNSLILTNTFLLITFATL